MAGISSKAANRLDNKFEYNGNEIQTSEFSDGTGLDVYDFNARTYDQQIGRFIQIDPMTDEGGQESLSPYHFSFNNPVTYNDPDGKFPFAIPVIWAIVEAVAGISATEVAAGVVIVGSTAVVAQTMKSGTNGGGGIVVGSPLGLTTGTTYQQLNAKGASNEKVNERREVGQEAHRQEQAKIKLEDPNAEIEKKVELKDRTVRKDAIKSDGTAVIIKPNTPSGQKTAKARQKLMEQNGFSTEIIYYDPTNKAYQRGSPTYIGPKKIK